MRKVRQFFTAVLSTIAPDQEDTVFDALLHSSGPNVTDVKTREEKEKVASKELSILLEVYSQSESRHTRLQILSMFARHFSRNELKEMIPGLSKWQIDQARRHAVEECFAPRAPDKNWDLPCATRHVTLFFLSAILAVSLRKV